MVDAHGSTRGRPAFEYRTAVSLCRLVRQPRSIVATDLDGPHDPPNALFRCRRRNSSSPDHFAGPRPARLERWNARSRSHKTDHPLVFLTRLVLPRRHRAGPVVVDSGRGKRRLGLDHAVRAKGALHRRVGLRRAGRCGEVYGSGWRSFLVAVETETGRQPQMGRRTAQGERRLFDFARALAKLTRSRTPRSGTLRPPSRTKLARRIRSRCTARHPAAHRSKESRSSRSSRQTRCVADKHRVPSACNSLTSLLRRFCSCTTHGTLRESLPCRRLSACLYTLLPSPEPFRLLCRLAQRLIRVRLPSLCSRHPSRWSFRSVRAWVPSSSRRLPSHLHR